MKPLAFLSPLKPRSLIKFAAADRQTDPASRGKRQVGESVCRRSSSFAANRSESGHGSGLDAGDAEKLERFQSELAETEGFEPSIRFPV
jgi:hypothetical protein